jgi:hypothetical protein
MTLRRCDSLPTRLREAPVPSPADANTDRPIDNRIPDSNTLPNFTEQPDRAEVIATWKSLHTDVKKIKNGYPVKNESPSHDKKESITQNSISRPVLSGPRKITYEHRKVGINGQEVDRCLSYPLDTGQPRPTVASTSLVRRRTLLDRLLPWRSRPCNCQERYVPKIRTAPRLRAEDLLCTCGVAGNRINLPNQCKQYSERGRSKSVGYEAAREVTQFRRLVQCITYETGS